MASNTKNVKLGVCKVWFGGVDLGYTKGGVEVEVQTSSKKVMVDQFGETEINERITGRTCRVKVPLAETTVENVAAYMPGATLVTTAGVAATGSYSFSATNPGNNETITVNGKVFTFKTGSAPLANQILIGGAVDDTITNAVAKLNASTDIKVRNATYVADLANDQIDITYDEQGVVGNAFTLVEGLAVGTVSAATLEGGVDPVKRVDVETGVGTSLLETAQELRLHPIELDDSNVSEDFVIPLANTPGNMTYAYKLDEERIFNMEFTGYPDYVTKALFYIGDEAAV